MEDPSIQRLARSRSGEQAILNRLESWREKGLLLYQTSRGRKTIDCSFPVRPRTFAFALPFAFDERAFFCCGAKSGDEVSDRRPSPEGGVRSCQREWDGGSRSSPSFSSSSSAYS